jgi:hypothetical protein
VTRATPAAGASNDAREIVGHRIGLIAAFIATVYPRFWATEGEVLSRPGGVVLAAAIAGTVVIVAPWTI